MASISVVIPTYNGSKFIEKAILSVINQTRAADEIIISDDNSLDGTLEICYQYENQVKIYCNSKGPSGFVNGWNHAIKYANCDYIAILHQDDLLAPTFLEEIERAIIDNPDVMHLFTPCNYIDEKGVIFKSPDYCDGSTKRMSGEKYVESYIYEGDPHVHRCPGVVTHRRIFDKCKYRPEAGHIADDDFFFRVGNYTDIVGVFKPLASYREHRYSETGHLSLIKINERLLHDYYFQLTECLDNPLFTERIKKLFKERESLYIRRLLVYAIKKINISSCMQAIKYFVKVTFRERGRNLWQQ